MDRVLHIQVLVIFISFLTCLDLQAEASDGNRAASESHFSNASENANTVDIGFSGTPHIIRKPGIERYSLSFKIGNMSDASPSRFNVTMTSNSRAIVKSIEFENFGDSSAECAHDNWRIECTLETTDFWQEGTFRVEFRLWQKNPIQHSIRIETDSKESDYTNNTTKYTAYPFNFAAHMPDFDGDQKADLAFLRPATNTFLIHRSSDQTLCNIRLTNVSEGIPIFGDFDGDSITDIGLYEPSTNRWVVLKSSDSSVLEVVHGSHLTDLPIAADYDGDGISDFAIKSMRSNEWSIISSKTNEQVLFRIGQTGDIPVVGDFDADWVMDVGVRQPDTGLWRIIESSTGEETVTYFGSDAEDIAVPQDYDGDGRADYAVRRPSSAHWFVKNSSTGDIRRTGFSEDSFDVPIVADYDGDGKADLATRRTSHGYQYILNSSDNSISNVYFGGYETDIPVSAPIQLKMAMINIALP